MRRRTFFGLVGAGAVGAALPVGGMAMGGMAGAAPGASARTEGRARLPNLDFLFAPLVGRPLTAGFRVLSVSGVERGSATVTLARADGARAQVQVFRRSPMSTGLATTRLLDLRLMNGGDGDRATHEGAGLAVMSLAARLRRIEAAAVRGGPSPEQRVALRALYTHEQRNALHGGFAVSETA